jgi:hypothetical protein
MTHAAKWLVNAGITISTPYFFDIELAGIYVLSKRAVLFLRNV